MSNPNGKLSVSKRKVALMPKSPYTLFVYEMKGIGQVVSAIHALDIRKFLAEHPDAKVHPSN